MNKTMSLFALALCLSSFAQVTSAGPVGTALTYQGRLQEAGSPLSGDFDMTFGLYNEAVDGTQVAPAIGLTAAVIGGLFTVELDFGPVFDGTQLWLEVQVRPSGGMNPLTTLSPRQKLTAAPYAMNAAKGHALNAADGSPIDRVFVDNDGNVGIGTTAPTADFDVLGALTVDFIPGPCPGDCCDKEGGGTGCSDGTCQATVCAVDPFCCTINWDSVCRGEASELCRAQGQVRAALEQDLMLGRSGPRRIFVEGEPDNNAAGKSLTIQAGNASSLGVPNFAQHGGNLILQAGNGFASGALARGGDVIVRSGANHISGTTNGGDIVFQTGGANNAFFERLKILDNGRVGIGRSPTANTLEVEGNASKTTATAWLANSDARIKTGITTLSNALEAIRKLHPVKFRYSEEYRKRHPSIQDRDYVNFVAQEYREVFPESVQDSGENGILQIDTHPAGIYAVAAVKELDEKVKARDAEIVKLKKRLARLEAAMSKLLEAGNVAHAP